MDNSNPDNRGEFFDQFLDDYYAECDEHLFSIRRSLVELENDVNARTFDRTVLDNLFRSFHTLKGISGMVGLGAAEQLAHHLESYLRELREGTVALSESGFQSLTTFTRNRRFTGTGFWFQPTWTECRGSVFLAYRRERRSCTSFKWCNPVRIGTTATRDCRKRRDTTPPSSSILRTPIP